MELMVKPKITWHGERDAQETRRASSLWGKQRSFPPALDVLQVWGVRILHHELVNLPAKTLVSRPAQSVEHLMFGLQSTLLLGRGVRSKQMAGEQPPQKSRSFSISTGLIGL